PLDALGRPGEEPERRRGGGWADRDGAEAGGAIAGRGRGGPPAGMAVGALAPPPLDLLGQRPPVAVRLDELDDGPVRLARVEERLLPVRVRQVDVDRPVPGGAYALEGCAEIVHLERQVV